MEIAHVEKDELPALAREYAIYYNAEGDTWTQEIALRRLTQALLTPDSVFLKAEIDGKTAGFLTGAYDWFFDGPILRISEMLVYAGMQGRGVGSALVRAAEAEARAFGARRAILESLTDARHERFYARLGYRAREDLRERAHDFGE